MPVLYECRSCNLRFTVGWFHYHTFNTGYCAKTLMVCTACGTQYAVEIACPDRGRATFHIHNVVIETYEPRQRVAIMKFLRKYQHLSLQQARETVEHLPITVAHDVPEWDIAQWQERSRLLDVTLAFPVIRTEPNPRYGPLMQDRLFGKQNPVFSEAQDLAEEYHIIPTPSSQTLSRTEILLDNHVCQYCHTQGCFHDELHPPDGCPHCQQSTLVEKGGWVT